MDTTCPICGHNFYDELQIATACPGCDQVITPIELIGEDEDYAWVI